MIKPNQRLWKRCVLLIGLTPVTAFLTINVHYNRDSFIWEKLYQLLKKLIVTRGENFLEQWFPLEQLAVILFVLIIIVTFLRGAIWPVLVVNAFLVLFWIYVYFGIAVRLLDGRLFLHSSLPFVLCTALFLTSALHYLQVNGAEFSPKDKKSTALDSEE